MGYEFVNVQRTCELSRKAFVRMLIGAIGASKDFEIRNTVDGYSGTRKKVWHFFDLGVKLVVYYDSIKEIEDLMKELKNENEKKTVNKD